MGVLNPGISELKRSRKGLPGTSKSHGKWFRCCTCAFLWAALDLVEVPYSGKVWMTSDRLYYKILIPAFVIVVVVSWHFFFLNVVDF